MLAVAGRQRLGQRGDTNDDAAFTTAINDVSSRVKTDAAVAWTPAAWSTVGAAGVDQRTPDLAAIAQEIVNRAGWAALNDMDFTVTGTGTRTASAFESGPTTAPLLHIEYALTGGFNPQTTVAASEATLAETSLTETLSGGTGGDILVASIQSDIFAFAPGFDTNRLIDFDGNSDGGRLQSICPPLATPQPRSQMSVLKTWDQTP